MKTLPEGFKDSDIGLIPQDWEVKALGELSTIARGGSPRPIEAYLTPSPGGINWVKIGDVASDSKYIEHTEERIISDGAKHSRFVQCGDLILSNSMSYGRPYIMHIDGCIHDGWLSISKFSDVLDKEFLYYILGSELTLKQYEGAASGSSVKNLNKDVVSRVLLPYPTSLWEQQAIADALSDMDALISAQEELLAKKRAIKQGAMQELLTGRRRLPGFPIRPMKQTDIGPIPEDWEVKELGALCNLIKEPGIPEPNGYCIELENIESNTGRLCGEVQKCIHATRFHYKADDVLYGRLRAYLQKYYYGRENGWCSTEIWVLRASDVASGFLRYLVASSRFAEAAAVTHGTHMPRSEWKVVEKTLFGIPSSISEQEAIAAVLSDMDAEITALEEELAKHRALKRGMMQELLSGRIRLPYNKPNHRKQHA